MTVREGAGACRMVEASEGGYRRVHEGTAGSHGSAGGYRTVQEGKAAIHSYA